MKKHSGQKKIGNKSCQSNLEKWASDFGFFLSYLITTVPLDQENLKEILHKKLFTIYLLSYLDNLNFLAIAIY